ncbi:hypothetical protein QJS10_CPB17g00170 [Acorus calamus]|uniref:Pectinesterase inhibitor domain-containing protein n=1 Tax=Acorus calamus TaxID=4465 RepID=A0AAV9CT82_ACOCL|nr:hypothetical protein QJS10_CPB17g00170 [Acorus calamus]
MALLLLSAVQHSSADANFIKTTCGHLRFRSDVCVRLLELDQRSYAATTNEELSNIALHIITNNYTKVCNFLRDMASQHQGEPIQDPCDQCVFYYDEAVQKLHDAQALMEKKAYNDASLLVDDAVNAPNSCESVFSAAVIPSPVKQTDAYLLDDSQVTRDLIRILIS